MKTKLWLVTIVIIACVQLVEAQQPTKVHRIGILRADTPAAFAPRNELFRETLRELGYAEEKNLRIDYRYAEGKIESFHSSR